MTATPSTGSTFFGLDLTAIGSQLMGMRRRLSKRLLLLEFCASGLRFAEASLSTDGVRFSHVGRIALPEEALERGVPSDPAIMAGLIKQICQEKNIPAHRAAVVLSPEVAYQRIVELPSELTLDQARNYLRDPVNAFPLPFPLEQTDFDITMIPKRKSSTHQPYLLTAIPQSLMERVIIFLQLADLEIHSLELGPFSVLRCIADQLYSLPNTDLHLLLELLPDCSQLSVVSRGGPLKFERLSAIRDFPEPELDDVQHFEAIIAGVSAEALMVRDDRYLPISELDLRAVVRDVKGVIRQLTAEYAGKISYSMTLSGINSAHPLLKELLQDALGIPVRCLNPVLVPGVVGYSPDDLLVQVGLARLMGLGLGFLQRDQSFGSQLLKADRSSLVETVVPVALEATLDSTFKEVVSTQEPLDVVVSSVVTELIEDIQQELRPNEEELVEVKPPEKMQEDKEEEWPSVISDVGLQAAELNGNLQVERLLNDEDSAAIKMPEKIPEDKKEVWPSITAIPGLSVPDSLLKSESRPPKDLPSNDSNLDQYSNDSGLGELRFSDE